MNRTDTKTTEEAMLPFKVLELADIVAEKKRLSIGDALFYLYNSQLYHDLLNPELKMWYYGGMQLYEFLEKEKLREKKMYPPKTERLFLIFCIEQYRLRGNLASATVLEKFIRLNVDIFIMDNFEVLHSQSAEYILHEIDVFIKKQR